MNTVKELRKSGYKVKVIHSRCITPYLENVPVRDIRTACLTHLICPKGGRTLVELRSPQGIEVKGEATCSKKDGFNRKLGLAKALGRAMSKIPS